MSNEYPIGATPLDPNEIEGLIPIHLTTQAELNEFEQYNILKAQEWIASKSFSLEKVLDQNFIRALHVRMFNETWRWAGSYRKTEKNIGVDPIIISTEIKKLLDDVKFQIENDIFHIDETLARFHHRLVSIHPFANGNGRHARLMSDVILRALNIPLFSWGLNDSSNLTEVRRKYLTALKEADKHYYQSLLKFVRS